MATRPGWFAIPPHMQNEPEYDYIISGAGCAGLSLVLHMIDSGAFRDKKILLVDRDPKNANDRTWCFWEQGEGLFEPVVYRSWDLLWFRSESFSKRLAIRPYRYKMIRGVDFYQYCLNAIRSQPNITLRYDAVDHVFSSDRTTGIVIGGKTIHAKYVFNSILFGKPELTRRQYWMLQHFKGWTIETGHEAFDPSTATLMDFRIPQRKGTAFCYVLPFTTRRALVEYTVFSPELLQPSEYDEGLRSYLATQLRLSDYRVEEEEFGVIPMTNFRFAPRQNHLIHIGTAGGQTKGSSGYTFRFIQKHSQALVQQLIQTGEPFLPDKTSRFQFYDSVLLSILHHGTLPGKTVFTDLFRKNDPAAVLQFLDNESSLSGELKLIASLPTLPFLRAALRQVF